MQTIKSLTLAAALTGAGLFSTAAVAAPAAAAPVLLEAVIVTPTATYTAAEWQARREAALSAVTLERVIVTPSRSYTVAEWQQRQALMHAGLKPRLTGMKTWLKTVWKHFVRRTPVEV